MIVIGIFLLLLAYAGYSFFGMVGALSSAGFWILVWLVATFGPDLNKKRD